MFKVVDMGFRWLEFHRCLFHKSTSGSSGSPANWNIHRSHTTGAQGRHESLKILLNEHARSHCVDAEGSVHHPSISNPCRFCLMGALHIQSTTVINVHQLGSEGES